MSKKVITCSVCGKRLNLPSSLAGRKVKCPGCGHRMRFPAKRPRDADAARAAPAAWRFADAPDAHDTPDAAPRDDGLLEAVQCPHCWHRFAPEDILWIAASDALMGDPVAGEHAYLRFPPSRFTVSGHAVDGKGAACRRLACPRCHLAVPRGLLTVPPSFVSVVGTAGAGKTYLLASMTHLLRRRLPDWFQVAFTDADAEGNLSLEEYERVLFGHGAGGAQGPEDDGFAALRKTETRGGDLYNEVRIGGQTFSFPRPFLFSLRPAAGHPRVGDAAARAMTLVLYDNAGESFTPGADTAAAPVTHHVAHSLATLFLFDPTQDADFRRRLDHPDPPWARGGAGPRQSVMLNGMVNLAKSLLGLHGHQRLDRTLVVAVGKYDIWRGLLRDAPHEPPVRLDPATGRRTLDRAAVDDVSLAVRDLLRRVTPDLVAAAESGWTSVRYLPVSATGRSPAAHPETGALGFRPADIRPIWADVPLLYVVARHGAGLVGFGDDADDADAPAVPGRRAGDLLLVGVPGDDAPLEAPADYAGRVVRCPRTGRRFRLVAEE